MANPHLTDNSSAVQDSKCPCGEPHDNWPGDNGSQLCQMCWERECDASWWRTMVALDRAYEAAILHELESEVRE